MATAPAPRFPFRLPQVAALRKPGSRAASRWLALGIVTLLIVTLVGALTHGFGMFGASSEADHVRTEPAERGNLMITVTEEGNLESASNVDVRCQVAGGSSILWIIPDGSMVKEGDDIVRLDGSTLEDQASLQRITFEKAQALRIQAEKDYSAAKIAVLEYVEGAYLKELQLDEASIQIAMENMRSAENLLVHTERMARKGYVTPLQLDAQRFAVQRAKLDLGAAETTKDVLVKYTKAKMVEQLESVRDSAEARMRSEQAASDLEAQRLKRMMTQLEQCTVKAPQDGMIVYSNEYSSFRGSSTFSIEEGASIRERQSIVKIPDLSQMQVKASVHESKVDSIRPGMRARITIQDTPYQGEVTTVANQPEPTSIMTSSVKKYATHVRIEGQPKSLKPGMTAKVEILIADLKDVVHVPVQAVAELGNKFYCWVKKGNRLERRQVTVGMSNNTSVEIRSGLEKGDEVVLNPTVPAERDELFKEELVDVASNFGKARSATAGKGAPGAGANARAALDAPPPVPGQPGAPAGGPPGAGPQGPGAGPQVASSGSGRGIDMAQLDRDGDHKISRAEAPERMQEYFGNIDTNGDGFLDAAELAAMRARRGAGGNSRGGNSPAGPLAPGAPGSHGESGGGR